MRTILLVFLLLVPAIGLCENSWAMKTMDERWDELDRDFYRRQMLSQEEEQTELLRKQDRREEREESERRWNNMNRSGDSRRGDEDEDE